MDEQGPQSTLGREWRKAGDKKSRGHRRSISDSAGTRVQVDKHLEQNDQMRNGNRKFQKPDPKRNKSAGNGSKESAGNRRRRQARKMIPRVYKTEICRDWEQRGACDFGDRCIFAHGHDELREKHDSPEEFSAASTEDPVRSQEERRQSFKSEDDPIYVDNKWNSKPRDMFTRENISGLPLFELSGRSMWQSRPKSQPVFGSIHEESIDRKLAKSFFTLSLDQQISKDSQ